MVGEIGKGRMSEEMGADTATAHLEMGHFEWSHTGDWDALGMGLSLLCRLRMPS